MKAVGARLPRYDGIAHVTGKTVFVDDVRVPGTLWTKALRSPVHHAGIVRLDTKAAEQTKGVHAVVTHKDVPLNVYGHLAALGIPADEPLLAEDDVRYKGQPIAVVAAEDEDTAQEAVERIEIEFEERPTLFDVRKAFDADAPKIHHWGNWYPHFEDEMDRRQIRSGDIDWAFEHADTIVQGVYRPAAIEHVPIETQVCQVVPEPSGRLTIYSCTQALYFSMGVVAAHLAGAAEQAEVRRRHGRRRLRRQGRHGHRDDVLAARAQVRPPGQVALDARGGVPLLVDAGAVAHGDRGRAHEGRLDPRPQDADAPRRRRVRALLALRAHEALASTTRARTRSRTSTSTATSCSRTACRRRRCAASASPRCRSRSRRT